ncbi:GNAT family N-acetyltransferase [Fusibacter sp. Q10-2]|uniref:GNAT family N-acetyltransferase n=2 Tax=Fusibacter ferrireducens TaxID=2785058 RepID=A0ABR9ZTX7_9FIRM|nr:GNAT family N-acetyltransferase [Fusibacter ferrireducens]MBF4693914.1 GNAT family N-acetyltransferase [Fusibacter ferrireducens]
MDVIIRNVNKTDLEAIVEVERQCFPAAEAAEEKSIKARMSTFPENFFVAEIEKQIVGFINGCTTNSPVIYDEMFHDTSHHIPSGEIIAIFGLDVIESYRRKGIASKLMKTFIENARKQGKKAVILTCKAHLIAYYEGFGFVNDGVSESTHGGAVWYDMTCPL